MNVLSLFDGMSCGQLALKKANISYENYYASEIDVHSISIAKKKLSQYNTCRKCYTFKSKKTTENRFAHWRLTLPRL